MAQNVGATLEVARSHDIITVVLTADNHLGCSSRGPMYRVHPMSGAFGQYRGAGTRLRRAQERLQRLRRAFQQATDFAVGQGVDLFIQAGDLFDTPNPTEQDRSFVAARLAELRQAGIRTFAVSGIHDTPDAGLYRGDVVGAGLGPALAPQVSYAHLGALHYFPPLSTDERGQAQGTAPTEKVALEPVMVDVRGNVLAVCGFSSPPMYRGVRADQEGDPLARVSVHSEVERAAISLLILHAPIEFQSPQAGQENGGSAAALLEHKDTSDIRKGQVGMHREGDSRLPVVARSTIAGQSLFGVIVAGYHHGYRHLRIGDTDVIVAGATEHVDFSDPDDDPGFVFLGLARDGVRWCHHVPGDGLHVRRLVIHTSELERSFARVPTRGTPTDDRGVKDDRDAIGSPPMYRGGGPTDVMLERLRPLCAGDSMVRLELVGELSRDQYHQLDLDRVQRYGEEHCFELTIDESGLSIFPGGWEGSLPMYRGGASVNGHGGQESGGHEGLKGEEQLADTSTVGSSRRSTELAERETSGLAEAMSSLVSRSPERSEGEAKDLREAEGKRNGDQSFLRPLRMTDGVADEMEERLSPREELVNLADEWIAEASDEQEKKALIATKEELLIALSRMKRR